MVLRCLIKSCTNTEGGEDGIRFFPFPKSPDRRRLWLDKIQRGGGETKRSSVAGDVLCSAHFTKDSFSKAPGVVELKDSAVPSEHLISRDDDSESHLCLVCKAELKHMCELLTDAHIHRNLRRQMVCGHCRKPFTTYSNLMAHVTELGVWKRFVPDKKPYAAIKTIYCAYQCSACSALFDTLVARNQHQATHIEEILASAVKELGPVQNREERPRQRRRKVLAGCEEDAEEETVEIKQSQSLSRPAILHQGQSEPAVKRFVADENGNKSGRAVSRPPVRKEMIARKTTFLNNRLVARRKQGDANKCGLLAYTIGKTPSLRHKGYRRRRGCKTLRCGFCWAEFRSLKRLDRHCSVKHPDEDTPLELTCDVDGDYDVLSTTCKACCSKESCINMLQELLDETDSDLETVCHDFVAQSADA